LRVIKTPISVRYSKIFYGFTTTKIGGNYMSKLVNRSELARRLGVSLTTIDNWGRNGCPFRKMGRTVLFDPDKVQDWRSGNKDLKKEAMGSPMNAFVNMGCLHFALWLAKKLRKDEKQMRDLFFEWIKKKDPYVTELQDRYDRIFFI
jgi:hypothetical protein